VANNARAIGNTGNPVSRGLAARARAGVKVRTAPKMESVRAAAPVGRKRLDATTSKPGRARASGACGAVVCGCPSGGPGKSWRGRHAPRPVGGRDRPVPKRRTLRVGTKQLGAGLGVRWTTVGRGRGPAPSAPQQVTQLLRRSNAPQPSSGARRRRWKSSRRRQARGERPRRPSRHDEDPRLAQVCCRSEQRQGARWDDGPLHGKGLLTTEFLATSPGRLVDRPMVAPALCLRVGRNLRWPTTRAPVRCRWRAARHRVDVVRGRSFIARFTGPGVHAAGPVSKRGT